MADHKHQSGATCAICGEEGVLSVHGRCHPQSPTRAFVYKTTLEIRCAECGKLIKTFELAEPFSLTQQVVQ